MHVRLIFIYILIILFPEFSIGQVRVRLFSDKKPESVVFSAIEGKYSLNAFNGETLNINIGEPLFIARLKGKLAVKIRNIRGFICDSLVLTALTGADSYSMRINGIAPVRQNYSGDLKVFPDFETLLLINTTNIEKYIAGVVKAEGGSGKNIEYFKTQAVIARTYMYKYFDKHSADKYNVCDNTHCQAFNGISPDTLINAAALETKDLVILDKDSTLIISAFHSNCGGETSSAEDVWLASQPYLKSVVDPYCITSRNARWEKSMSLNDWIEYIKKSGYTGNPDSSSVFSFIQKGRLTDYKSGSFSMPLRTIRNELNLRSTFFSVIAKGDSIILKGRGYGHGVGLCQEGSMTMAAKGFNYKQIIDFYYTGVNISDIKNAVILPKVVYSPTPVKVQVLQPNPNEGGLGHN